MILRVVAARVLSIDVECYDDASSSLRNENWMHRRVANRKRRPTLWEAVIPQCLVGLPGDLAEIDALLDDERFFEPFRPFFDPRFGRPSIPMETYFRMMFLKYRSPG